MDIQKILQPAEPVRGAQRLDRWIRQRDAVAFGEAKHGFRLDRPLDVQMQLGLRQALDKSCHEYLPTVPSNAIIVAQGCRP